MGVVLVAVIVAVVIIVGMAVNRAVGVDMLVAVQPLAVDGGFAFAATAGGTHFADS
jgi:hypothetical protein